MLERTGQVLEGTGYFGHCQLVWAEPWQWQVGRRAKIDIMIFSLSE